MANASYLLEMVIGGRTDASFNRSIAGATYGINTISNITSKATKAIIGGLAAAGGAALAFVANAQQTYKEFESAMANTAAIANATAQQEAAMEEAARYAGRTTTMTATQSAEALGYMALAGWSVSDSTKALLPILRLAEATQADLQTTSDLVTDSMGALGLSVKDLDVYMDKLVATNNNANTTAEMLMEALIKTGGASQAIGASLDDTITSLGVLASAGFKAEEAGTAMNSMLTRIAANKEAKNGLDALGVSIFDENGKFIGLRETLIRINNAMQGLSDEEKMASLRLVAGTRRVSQFEYLLNSVGTTAEGVTSQWDTLEEHVVNSTGALDVMNEKATDTMAAAQERLVSAWNDLKIGFTGTYGDFWKEGLDDLAQRLPELTDRIEEFGRTHREEIRAFVKGIGGFLERGANGLFNLISFIIRNKDSVMGIVTGTVSGLSSMNLLTKFLQIRANLALIGPEAANVIGIFGKLGFVVGGVVGGTMAIVGAIKKVRDEAIRANLDEHFGNVALSLAEIEEIAKRLTFADEYGLYKAFGSASDELERIQQGIDGAKERLDKYDWKINIGLGLNGEDSEDYKAAIDEFVNGAQNYLNQQHYQLTLAYDILFGEASDEAIAGVDSFYSSQLQELTSLGEQLRNAVNEGFSNDGLLDINEQEEIRNLQKKMEAIQQGLADSKYQAKLDILEDKYGGTKLDATSYKMLVEELGEASQSKIDTLAEAREAAYGLLETRRQSGDINDVEYETEKAAIRERYLQNIAGISSDNAVWLANQAFGAYEGDIGKTYDQLKFSYNKVIEDTLTGRRTFAEAMNNIELPDLSWRTKGALQSLLDEMQPQKEQLIDAYEELVEAGQEIPQSLIDAMDEIEHLESLASGETFGSHFYNILARQILNSPEHQKTLLAAAEAGEDIPEELMRAIEANSGQVVGSAVTMYENYADALKVAFSRGFNVNARVNVTPVASFTNAAGELRAVFEGGGSTKGYRYAGSILSNAAGGIYNHEILTTAAEDGPEAIIPLDSTARARALWAEAGRRMGLIGGRDTMLADSMDAGATRTTDNSTHQVTFSPNITINGNASKEEVAAGLRDAYPEFERMMERYQREQRRVSFR